MLIARTPKMYKLKLHERYDYGKEGLSILRVPGGWIYSFWDYEKKDYYSNRLFVPFNNDFQVIKTEEV